jgi:polysaccharide pyruvyl transferase WcaK-like protein
MPKILVDSEGFESKGFMAIVIGLAKCLKAYIPGVEIVVLSHHMDRDSRLSRFGFEVCRSPWVWTGPNRGLATILRYAIFSSFDLLSFLTLRVAQRLNSRIKLLPDDYDLVIHYDPDWYGEPERSTWGIILPLIRLFILRTSCHKPYVTLPSSMGPFKSRLTRKAGRLVLNRLELLALREETSYDYVRNLQLTKPQIQLTSDLAFLCDPAPKEKVEEIIQAEGITRSNKPFVGICPSRGPMKSAAFSQMMSQKNRQENYLKVMAQIIDYIVEKFDATVCLISHHDGDVKLCQQIYETATHKQRVAYLHKEYLADELKGIIGGCDMFLGSLMHSTIASTSMGVPTIAIAYADKFYRLIGKTMGVEKYIIDIRDKEPEEFLTEIKRMIDSLWANREKVKQGLIERAKVPQEQAWSYAKLIKELIS